MYTQLPYPTTAYPVSQYGYWNSPAAWPQIQYPAATPVQGDTLVSCINALIKPKPVAPPSLDLPKAAKRFYQATEGMVGVDMEAVKHVFQSVHQTKSID